MMSDEKTVCPKCQRELQVGDYPYCKGKWSDHEGGHYGVVGDDIPGGVWIRHGICNPDGSARRYDTKSSITAEAKRRGLIQSPRHVDGDKHLSRWV
jgi:hypothetical protein